jgi:heparosan-N-sulfate-glucuronate 5-epimerase
MSDPDAPHWYGHKANWSGAVDSDGIPLYDLRSARLRGLTHHPVSIIQYALAHWDLLCDGRRDSKAVFMRCVRWLENNAVEEPGDRFATWLYCFPLRTPPVSAPWISGMAQGQALSVLARAHQLTGSARTAELARRAVRGFLYTIADGGLITRDSAGRSFIEEIATHPAQHILNGCLYGFVGVLEHNQVFPDPAIAALLGSCIAGIERLLPRFDTGYWSSYSLGVRWRLAPTYYHHVHVRQLRYLGRLLGRESFLARAARWEGYVRSRRNRARHHLCEWLQTNANRTMTVLRLNAVKYRAVRGWDPPRSVA